MSRYKKYIRVNGEWESLCDCPSVLVIQISGSDQNTLWQIISPESASSATTISQLLPLLESSDEIFIKINDKVFQVLDWSTLTQDTNQMISLHYLYAEPSVDLTTTYAYPATYQNYALLADDSVAGIQEAIPVVFQGRAVYKIASGDNFQESYEETSSGLMHTEENITLSPAPVLGTPQNFPIGALADSGHQTLISGRNNALWEVYRHIDYGGDGDSYDCAVSSLGTDIGDLTRTAVYISFPSGRRQFQETSGSLPKDTLYSATPTQSTSGVHTFTLPKPKAIGTEVFYTAPEWWNVDYDHIPPRFRIRIVSRDALTEAPTDTRIAFKVMRVVSGAPTEVLESFPLYRQDERTIVDLRTAPSLIDVQWMPQTGGGYFVATSLA